jgi:DNA (cytosine-5)-methyltransferase 1
VQSNKLQTLDLFAGVGAFSLGMKESAGFNVTHAIEIGPSTAETLR